jgi:hypothetical protein
LAGEEPPLLPCPSLLMVSGAGEKR